MVRTRIAPSPTGDPHIGTAYTALFNFAFARKNKGKFILRIEDTDQTRLVPEAENKIIDSLQWLGLTWDEGPLRQSERLSLYQKAADKLVEKGAAYRCNCSKQRLEKLRKEQQAKGEVPRYDGKCRSSPPKSGPFVVRLKVPTEGETSFEDLIRGKITFQNKDIDDAVLLKSDGWPTYHLAAVVDDLDMKISHVIRAEEWLSSTPKHLLIYEAFGKKPPVFAHLPLLRNTDKSKISKRKNPVSLPWYKEQGYLPEAILNYLALMGWSMPDEREVFAVQDFIENFDLKRVDPTGPIFDLQKLDWLNGAWIRSLPEDMLVGKLKDYTGQSSFEIEKVLPLVQERMKKLSEFDSLTGFFFKEPSLSKEPLLGIVGLGDETKQRLNQVLDLYQRLDWKAAVLEEKTASLVENQGWRRADMFMLVRVATTGSRISPPLFQTLAVLGKEKTIRRLQTAVRLLS
ncbi:MAG: glutamate--tRNA ligase [Candidatus Woykebacteria bacterium GWB1_45_5]|uniref:Glutamate--tRNA ligase n=2 Tax=Candidatus Woykeibacteriota TaxID=1817899 RepID=A0A1G1W2D1_9BACT|nr:MAG: glutamate--tRNA ligase [Candidatus Woykebacteria bacterium GWA1_44_8]OGY22823.1 MAG: glutamate--tRNA ligase [Candidatus Woykebacteria bacterium GWB1_45_5]